MAGVLQITEADKPLSFLALVDRAREADAIVRDDGEDEASDGDLFMVKFLSRPAEAFTEDALHAVLRDFNHPGVCDE